MTSDEAIAPKSRRRRATPPQPPAAPAAERPVVVPSIAEDGSAIQADYVDVRMGAVGRVESERLEVVQGAIGGARAGSVSVQQGVIGGALADQVTVRQGFARSILARDARVEQSFVRTLVAGEVHVERATGVGILLARRVVGDVRVLLDWRGALALGAAFGLVARLGRGRGWRRGDRRESTGGDRPD
jgi:hypothetical protein